MWKSKHNTIILIILLILSFAYNTNAFFFYLIKWFRGSNGITNRHIKQRAMQEGLTLKTKIKGC